MYSNSIEVVIEYYTDCKSKRKGKTSKKVNEVIFFDL